VGSGLQPAIVRAHSRACSASVMPGNSRRSSQAAEISTALVNCPYRCGLSFADNEHHGSMGMETMADKPFSWMRQSCGYGIAGTRPERRRCQRPIVKIGS
jgi:hypothetical protein